ncbi:hypothetical protein EV401DRAFT_2199267 [Pisolithus croceorrhizus]|nr:hypothetical protein EV401DRAFT_2199267 [Pisolithus croceorrhizus]
MDINKWKTFYEMFQKVNKNINLLVHQAMSYHIAEGECQFPESHHSGWVIILASKAELHVPLSCVGRYLDGTGGPDTKILHNPPMFHFKIMVLVLGFIAMLIVHFSAHAVMLGIYAAFVIIGLKIVYLFLYCISKTTLTLARTGQNYPAFDSKVPNWLGLSRKIGEMDLNNCHLNVNFCEDGSKCGCAVP